MKKIYIIKQFLDGQWVPLAGEYKHLFAAAEKCREMLKDKCSALIVVRIETSEYTEAYFPQ